MTVTPVIKVAVPRPIYSTYEYSINPAQETPCIGGRVAVPFGKDRDEIGICIQAQIMSKRTDLKSISKILDTEPVISPNMMSFAHWISQYYVYPLGEVLFSMLPSFLRKGKPLRMSDSNRWELKDPSFENKRAHSQTRLFNYVKENPGASTETLLQKGFSRETIKTLERKNIICQVATEADYSSQIVRPKPTQEQQLAIDAISYSLDTHQTFLLEGITGSGKTEIYLRAIEPHLNRGRQALILVPEIGLTPQMVSRFEDRFCTRVTIINSSLTDKQRAQAWIDAKEGQSGIILGTRSAIFTPLKNLGIIIVDEEHDLSFKQQEGFRYSARDLAIYRSHTKRIPIILGSATPSLESFFNAKRGKYKKLSLNTRTSESHPEKYRVIDTSQFSAREGLTQFAIRSIQKTLSAGKQALVFVNQRGFCPVLLCEECKQIATCDRCQVKLTYHQTTQVLSCHHCGRVKSYPAPCESCGSSSWIHLGVGTERLEKFLSETLANKGTKYMELSTDKYLYYSNSSMKCGDWIGHSGLGGQFLAINLKNGIVASYFSVIETDSGTCLLYTSPSPRDS